jgi:hypothetical protein
MPSEDELKEHAKNSSEQALANAVKQSNNPTVRQVAQAEIKRRQTEEKPMDDKEKDTFPSKEVMGGEGKESEKKAPEKKESEKKQEPNSPSKLPEGKVGGKDVIVDFKLEQIRDKKTAKATAFKDLDEKAKAEVRGIRAEKGHLMHIPSLDDAPKEDKKKEDKHPGGGGTHKRREDDGDEFESEKDKKDAKEKMFDLVAKVYDKLDFKDIQNEKKIASVLKELGYPNHALMVGVIKRHLKEGSEVKKEVKKAITGIQYF